MFVSEALALGSAACIALGSMFISELSGRVPLMQLARWQLSAGLVFTAAAATAVGGWSSLGAWQLWALTGSGAVGIALASTTYFAAIFVAGPRITALLFTLTSPFALALGCAVLGERINRMQALGVALILLGVVIAIGVRRRPPAPLIPLANNAPNDPHPSPLGIMLGVVTALGQAVGTLLARPAMASGVEAFAAMAIRTGVAVLCIWALLALPAVRGKTASFRPMDFSLAMAAAFCGPALGMSLLMAALRSGDVGIVSTLSSMTPVVILPMVWLRSGQAPRPLAWAGAMLAIVGTALIGLA